MPIHIAIVEDDEQTRRIIGSFVREHPALELVGDFPDGEAALAGLPAQRPEVVLMDVNLPRLSGVECVSRLKPLLPQAQFLMLTVYDDPEHIFKALAAGATGYLLKSTSREDLLSAILQIQEGGSPMSSAIARKVVQSFSARDADRAEVAALSGREEEVLRLLSEGYLYKEIADQLQLSVLTIKTYTRRIYEKLHVRSRSQAAAKYFQRLP